MANPKHVKIVKQGAEAIDKWREKNPGVRLDLNRANLVEANLDGANLAGANLAGANLCGANLVMAILVEANLGKANLDGANLDGAACARTSFDDVNLSAANGLEQVTHHRW